MLKGTTFILVTVHSPVLRLSLLDPKLNWETSLADATLSLLLRVRAESLMGSELRHCGLRLYCSQRKNKVYIP
jgi:hypothetical protein